MTFYDLQKMYNANNDKALAFSKAQYSEINTITIFSLILEKLSKVSFITLINKMG